LPGLTNTRKNAQKSGKNLLIVIGQGQNNIATSQFVATAQALSDWQIDVIGQRQPENACAKNLHFHGWVNNPEHFITNATVVAGAASDGLNIRHFSRRKTFYLHAADPAIRRTI